MRKGLEIKEKELLELEEKLNAREQASLCTSSTCVICCFPIKLSAYTPLHFFTSSKIGIHHIHPRKLTRRTYCVSLVWNIPLHLWREPISLYDH